MRMPLSGGHWKGEITLSHNSARSTNGRDRGIADITKRDGWEEEGWWDRMEWIRIEWAENGCRGGEW